MLMYVCYQEAPPCSEIDCNGTMTIYRMVLILLIFFSWLLVSLSVSMIGIFIIFFLHDVVFQMLKIIGIEKDSMNTPIHDRDP